MENSGFVSIPRWKGGGFVETVLPGMGVDTEEGVSPNPCNPWIQLSPADRAVLDAGRELWRYDHAQPGANPMIGVIFLAHDVQAKGWKNGVANSLLDACPCVGWVKCGDEFQSGEWFPDFGLMNGGVVC